MWLVNYCTADVSDLKALSDIAWHSFFHRRDGRQPKANEQLRQQRVRDGAVRLYRCAEARPVTPTIVLISWHQ